MANSLTETVDRLRTASITKVASHGDPTLRALAATVRAAPLRPVSAGDFHAVKQADWTQVAEERSALVEKVSTSKTPLAAIAAAVRIAGIDDLTERRDKIASAGVVARALTILQRGST